MLNKFFGGIKDIWFCTKYFAKFAWKHLPIYYLYILMSVIISTAGPFVSIIGSKYLINEIVYDNILGCVHMYWYIHSRSGKQVCQ